METRAMGFFRGFGFGVYARTELLPVAGGATCMSGVQHLTFNTQHQQDGYDSPSKKKNDNFDGCFSLCTNGFSPYSLDACSKLL